MSEITSGSVFVSYRRQDTRHVAGRVFDRLAERFGRSHVFMDVVSIEPGLDFAEAIDHAVSGCTVLLVLIGQSWLSAADEHGQRRLDNPDDLVLLEVKAALDQDVRVIPVLVDGASAPRRDDLPEVIAGLTRRNWVRLDHETFGSDVGVLMDVLDRIFRRDSGRGVIGPSVVVGQDDVEPCGPVDDSQQFYSGTGDLAAQNQLSPMPAAGTVTTVAASTDPTWPIRAARMISRPRQDRHGRSRWLALSTIGRWWSSWFIGLLPPTTLAPNRRPASSRAVVVLVGVVTAVVLSATAITLLASGSGTTGTAPNISTPPGFISGGPADLAITPDGRRAYVASSDSGTMSVIDTGSNTVTATIPVGRSARGVAITPDGRRAYIASSSGTVSAIDTGSNTVTATIPVGTQPERVAVTPNGRHAYITNYGSGTVSVIDTGSNTVTATIPVGPHPQGVAITPDGRHAYIINLDLGTVSVIDTGSNAVTVTAAAIGTGQSDVAITPDGRRAYITNSDSNTVSAIDTGSNTVTATIPVGKDPRGVAITPDGRRAYITNRFSNTFSVIDTGVG